MSISKLEAGALSLSAFQQNRLGASKSLLDASEPVDVKELSSISGLEAGTLSLSALQQNGLGASKSILDATEPVDVKELSTERPDFLKNLTIKGINSIPKDYDAIKLNLVDVYGESVDTRGFEQFVNHLGLNQEQTSTLQNTLQAVSEAQHNSQTQGDTYGLRISQVNLELKYISKKLVPEQYQDQFNSLVNDSTQQLSDHYVDYLTNFANQLASRTDSVAIQTGWQGQGKEILNSLQNGSSDFQVSENQYQSLYSTVDVTDPDKVKDQLDSVYKGILSNNGAYPITADNSSLVKEIKFLSEGWNKVMDAMGDQKNKFTTAVDWLA